MPSLFRSLSPRFPWMILIAAALACASASAWAQQDRGRGGPSQHDQGNREIPRPRSDEALSDAVRRIERSNRGQVLSAERMQSDGREVNRIKIVDDRGRVRVYMDDPPQDREPPARNDDD